MRVTAREQSHVTARETSRVAARELTVQTEQPRRYTRFYTRFRRKKVLKVTDHRQTDMFL